MTTRTEQAPSIARLARLVERVAPRDPVRWESRPPLRRGRLCSASRALQLRATVRQLAAAVERGGMPEGAGDDVAVLLSPEGVDAFLELARDGELRDPDKPARMGRPLSEATLGALRDCLKILGEEAGLPALVLPKLWRPSGADLAPVPTPGQAAALYRRLADMAAAAPLDALLARTLACVGVLLDTGMRRGDMVSRRLEHLDLEAGTLVVSHHRQNGAHRPSGEAVAELRPGTVVALKRWLPFRQALVDALEGSDPGALWVTVWPACRDGQTWPAGMPLGGRGFAEAYANGVDRLNSVLAGLWEGPGRWEPLPRRPEQLRRAVELERAGLVS